MKNKVGCVFPVAVAFILSHAEFGLNEMTIGKTQLILQFDPGFEIRKKSQDYGSRFHDFIYFFKFEEFPTPRIKFLGAKISRIQLPEEFLGSLYL